MLNAHALYHSNHRNTLRDRLTLNFGLEIKRGQFEHFRVSPVYVDAHVATKYVIVVILIKCTGKMFMLNAVHGLSVSAPEPAEAERRGRVVSTSASP